MLSMDRLSDCDIPYGENLVISQTWCSFWWDNDPDNLGNAAWGLMNLNQWDVLPTDQCSNAGFDSYRDWILYGYPGYLGMNDPPPTYVCRDSGFFGGALDVAIEAAILAGGKYAFPVNDPGQQIDRNGDPCPPPDCTPDKYYIVGFAWLSLIDICKGTGGGTWSCKISNDNADPYCTGFLVDSNARCLISEWVGWTTSGLAPSEVSTFGNMIAVTLSG